MGIEEAVETGKLEESGSDPNFANFANVQLTKT
jgi:hypothetical protein